MFRGSYIPNVHSSISIAEINLSKYTSLGFQQTKEKSLGRGVVTNFDL